MKNVNVQLSESFTEKFSKLEFHLMNWDELWLLGAVTEMSTRDGDGVVKQNLLSMLGYKAGNGDELFREMGGFVGKKMVVTKRWVHTEPTDKVGAAMVAGLLPLVERLGSRKNLSMDELENLVDGRKRLAQHGWVEEVNESEVVVYDTSLIGDQRKILCSMALKVWCGGVTGMEELEKSWIPVVGESCSKGHSHLLFGKFSLTCTNSKKVVTKRWVEETVGVKNRDGDMTGGGMVEKVRTGVCEVVSSSPCGEVPYGIVQLNGWYESGKLLLGDWYDGIRLLTGVSDATEKEINMSFTGGKRKYGMKKVFGEDVVVDEKMQAEFLRNEKSHKSVDGTHATKSAQTIAGSRNHEGRLKGKSGKIRSEVDGKLKGSRVNGSRTETPADYSTDGWFECWVDGKRLEVAQSASDILMRLMECGEVPEWKYLVEDVKELTVGELENLAEATGGGMKDGLVKQLTRAVVEPVLKSPKEVLLLLGVAMGFRDQANSAWMKRNKKRAQKRLRVDLMGGEGRVEFGLWRKMKFEGDENGEVAVKTRSAFGDALWKALQDAVSKLG